MTVATLRLDLRIGGCHSAREKRRRMQTIMTKLRKHFNISVAATDMDGEPSGISFLFAAAGSGRREVFEILERITEALAVYPGAELLSHAISEV
ncbi:DUF503 domain-containing protein [Singulisphaera sp. PoT]|uniref:DUF503 domain-containing protein n=1 Tax=Singulisphaera sp. PoT TaxID=3411797 RepID=UPI003BF55D60